MRTLRPLAALATILLALIPALAQNAPTYKIASYELRIEPDFAASSVNVQTTITIDNPQHLKEFEFTVRQPFTVANVSSPGNTATLQMDGDTLKVTIGKAATSVRLNVLTSAANAKAYSEDRAVVDADSLFLIWSDAFYPIDFDQWAPVKTTLLLPENFKAVAPGRLVSRTKSATSDKYEVVFESKQPQVCFSVFADSRWKRTETVVAGQKIVTLLHPEVQKYSDQIATTSADVLKFFAELHGSPAPEEFAFVSIPGMGGRRAFSGFIGYPPAALDREMQRTGYDAHETSLLWWGHTAHATGRGAWQWNEGFGDYVEFMYGEARNKPLPQIFSFFRDAYISSDFAQEPLYNQLRGNTPQKWVHGKYPWLMSALRVKIGDEAFRKGLRKLFADYRCNTYNIDQLFAVFEQTSGQSLKKFRADWLERKGVPQVTLTVSSRSDSKSCTISGTVEQQGELTNMPLDVRIATPRGNTNESIVPKELVARFAYTIPSSGPTTLQIDPDHKLLLKIVSNSPATLCQPTTP